MVTVVLIAQLTIVASGPPLKPADAAATLRRASPDREVRAMFPLDALPVVINVTRPPDREPESWIDHFDRAQARLRRADERYRNRLGLPCLQSQACATVIFEEPRRRHRDRRSLQSNPGGLCLPGTSALTTRPRSRSLIPVKETLTEALAFLGLGYLAVKMVLSVVVYVQAWMYEDVVTPEDPAVRAQVDAYRAEQERARRNYLADLAEAAKGNPVNLRGEERLAAERMGQQVGQFAADVIAKEIESRRKFKLGLFAAATSLISKP